MVDREPYHQGLGDAVEHGAQHDRERRAILLGAGRVLAISSTGAIDPPVPDGEHRAPSEDAGDGRPVPRRGVDGLLDEIEGDGADEHTGTEAHYQADCPQRDVEHERDDGAHHERRRRQGSPSERRAHQPC